MPIRLKNFDEACIDNLRDKPKLIEATLDEAIKLFKSGNLSTARFHLNHYVQATMGIKTLSALVKQDDQLLKIKLAHEGKPTRNDFSTMFKAIQKYQCIKNNEEFNKGNPNNSDLEKSSSNSLNKTSSTSCVRKM